MDWSFEMTRAKSSEVDDLLSTSSIILLIVDGRVGNSCMRWIRIRRFSLSKLASGTKIPRKKA